MKIKFLLPLLLLSTMSLAGCNSKGNKGNTESGSSGEQSETTTETETGSEEEKEYSEFEGQMDSFPAEYVADFLEFFGFEVTLPSVEAEGTWNYQQSIYNGYANFYATISDAGTPGTDAIEDSYKAVLEAAGFVVDDSDYEETGYVVTDEKYEDFQLVFYTYDGDFIFDLYGEFMPFVTEGFPVELALEFLNDQLKGMTLTANDLIVPEDNAVWYSYVYSGFFGDSYDAYREGTEDEVKAFAQIAKDAGWEVDDLQEEYPEYYDNASFDIYKNLTEDIELDIYVTFGEGLFSISVSLYDYTGLK